MQTFKVHYVLYLFVGMREIWVNEYVQNLCEMVGGVLVVIRDVRKKERTFTELFGCNLITVLACCPGYSRLFETIVY